MGYALALGRRVLSGSARREAGYTALDRRSVGVDNGDEGLVRSTGQVQRECDGALLAGRRIGNLIFYCEDVGI